MASLFDSNIVIDALKGIPAAIEEIAASDDVPAVSVITRIEVFAGCPDAESLAAARALLSGFSVLGISSAVEEDAIALRRTTRLKLSDAVILATARVHGLMLSTRNTRDFRADFPEVRIPYQL